MKVFIASQRWRLRLPPQRAGSLKWHATAMTLALPTLILLLWCLAVHYQWVPYQTLPSPLLVASTAGELMRDDWAYHVVMSLQRLAQGLFAGIVAGGVLGSLMGLNQHIHRLLSPTLMTLAQVPNIAWIPLLMMYLGIGEALKFAIIFTSALIPMAVHSQSGIRDISPKLKDVAQLFGLTTSQRIKQLYLPGALPSLLSGVRLAVASAWTALVVVELLASSEGIGYLMVWGRQMFQIDIVFVAIMTIAVLGLLIDWGLRRAEQRLLFWPQNQHLGTVETNSGGLLPWLLPALLIASWWLVTQQQWVAPYTLPAFSELRQVLVSGVADGTLPEALFASLQRAAWGFITGTLAGASLGLATGQWRNVDHLLTNSLDTLRQVPIFAWLPLMTAWVGTGEAARIAFIAMAVFFPVFVSMRQGVRGVSPQLSEVATLLDLRFGQRLRRLILPSAASPFFTGLRLALVFAWMATIGAEYFMASTVGIGSLMINAQQMFNVATVMTCVLLIAVTGTLLNVLGVKLQHAAQAWRQT